MPLHPMRLVTAASASLAVYMLTPIDISTTLVGTALADPASQASVTPAAASSIVRGNVIVTIVALNKSGIRTDDTVLCSATEIFSQVAIATNHIDRVKAQVAPDRIVCKMVIHYEVEPLNTAPSTVSITAGVDNYGFLGANDPIPIYSYQSISIPFSSFLLPANNSNTYLTITTVI